MNIKQAIEHLEELKSHFEQFEMVKTKEEDVEAFKVAITTMSKTANLIDELSLFNSTNDITNKKSTCHCCKETENLTLVLDLKLCPVCIETFQSYRKMINDLR